MRYIPVFGKTGSHKSRQSPWLRVLGAGSTKQMFCQDTFVCSGPRDVKQFCYASLRLRQPKQRVRKTSKTCSHNQVKYLISSCYLNFDKILVLRSLHLQHVAKATDATCDYQSSQRQEYTSKCSKKLSK